MKKILLSVLFIMTALCRLQAQEMETRVKVHCGETPLENLLTEEQKKSVTYLTVTGTLLDEDYAFLRNGLLNQLDTLDLKDTEIDTIPAGALGEMELYLILPKCIKCIEDYKFTGKCEVTGNFPYLGEFKGRICTKPLFLACDKHPNMMNIETENSFSVYSQDGEILYAMRPLYEKTSAYSKELRVEEGTRYIHATAFRGETFYPGDNTPFLVLPASLDSIGDNAFSDILVPMIVGYPNGMGSETCRLVCKAARPPKFGEIGTEDYLRLCNLYVPKESVDEYKKAKGWNKTDKISSLDDINGGESVSALVIPNNKCIAFKKENEDYFVNFLKPIDKVEMYNVSGLLILSVITHETEMKLQRSILSKPCTLLRVYFSDGTTETVKLIP